MHNYYVTGKYMIINNNCGGKNAMNSVDQKLTKNIFTLGNMFYLLKQLFVSNTCISLISMDSAFFLSNGSYDTELNINQICEAVLFVLLCAPLVFKTDFLQKSMTKLSSF